MLLFWLSLFKLFSSFSFLNKVNEFSFLSMRLSLKIKLFLFSKDCLSFFINLLILFLAKIELVPFSPALSLLFIIFLFSCKYLLFWLPENDSLLKSIFILRFISSLISLFSFFIFFVVCLCSCEISLLFLMYLSPFKLISFSFLSLKSKLSYLKLFSCKEKYKLELFSLFLFDVIR